MKYLLSALTICKIKVHCCILLPLHMVYTKFHRNRPLTTLVTRWKTLKTLNRVFSISQKWDLPGYSTKPLNCGFRFSVQNAKFRDSVHFPSKTISFSPYTLDVL